LAKRRKSNDIDQLLIEIRALRRAIDRLKKNALTSRRRHAHLTNNRRSEQKTSAADKAK
jgi:hypothetical protein